MQFAWQQGLIVFAVAFLVTFATVPLAKRIAKLCGAIDYPGNRRVNTEPVPRCGGIAMYLGIVAGAFTIFVGVRWAGWELHDLYTINNVNYILLFVGVTVMFTVGLIDDITQLGPAVKFGGQVIAAVIVVMAGVSVGTIRTIGVGTYVPLGWLDMPVSVLYLLVFVNITNLIDGLDGLASGITAIVAAALLYLVLMRGSMTLAFMCVTLIAVCLAFLRYNFYPASIFMGDSGALLLGLVMGIISVSGIVRTQSLIIMLVPLAIAGVPVLDTLAAIIRRLRGHQRIEQADMEHVHHKLMKAGFGQRKAVAVLWACSAGLAVAGCAVSGLSGVVRYGVLVALAVVILIVVHHFGLFKPVLKHYYDNKGGRGPRLPRFAKGAGKTIKSRSDANSDDDSEDGASVQDGADVDSSAVSGEAGGEDVAAQDAFDGEAGEDGGQSA